MSVLSERVFHVNQMPVMMRPDSTVLMVIDLQDSGNVEIFMKLHLNECPVNKIGEVWLMLSWKACDD